MRPPRRFASLVGGISEMAAGDGPRVAVVGGGLAGLSASVRLLQAGFAVTLYEASDRLGGKAGAVSLGGQLHDHGYHIFPAWYLNV